jgi:AcrR family transcriptional regulator
MLNSMPDSRDQPVKSRRERRAERVRRELGAIAVREFVKRGFENVTVEEIAQLGDYSTSTVFRYFGIKEDLVFFDMAEAIAQYKALLDAPLEPDGAWPRIRSILLDTGRDWEMSDPKFAVGRTRLFLKEPALVRRFLEVCADYELVIKSILLRERGDDYESRVACGVHAGAVVAAYRTSFAIWIENGGRLVDHVEAAIRVAEKGFTSRSVSWSQPVAANPPSTPST